MENIIKKAIEGGYETDVYTDMWLKDPDNYPWEFEPLELLVNDPLFWQALGKECGWGKQRIWLNPYTPKGRYIPNQNVDRWTQEAMNFHEINLTEGWDKAIEYLQSITTPEGSK